MKGTLKAKVIGEGDNPHTLDSSQSLRWDHHLGAAVEITSALNKDRVWAEISGRGHELNDTLYEGRWALVRFGPESKELPRTLFIAMMLAAEELGNGIIIGWRDGSPAEVIAQQAYKLADISVCHVDFYQTLDSVDDPRPLHVLGISPNTERINPVLITEVAGAIKGALRKSKNALKEQVFYWKDLPKLWRKWLAKNHYMVLMSGSLGFGVRHDNHLTREQVNKPNWVPDADLALRRGDLEMLLLVDTLMQVGLEGNLKRHMRELRKFIESQKGESDLLKLSVEDQGDFAPKGDKQPHLMSHAYKMLRGE